MLQRLCKTGAKAVPVELKLQIMTHIFQGWTIDADEEYEDVYTTVARLLVGHNLDDLIQDACNTLVSTATWRSKGTLGSLFDAMYTIENTTRAHPYREHIVNFELQVPLGTALKEIGTGSYSYQKDYSQPAVAERALRTVPHLRNLTIKLWAPSTIGLLLKLTSLGCERDTQDTQVVLRFLLGLQAMVKIKDINVELQACTQQRLNDGWNMHALWAGRLSENCSVLEFFDDMFKTVGKEVDNETGIRLGEMASGSVREAFV